MASDIIRNSALILSFKEWVLTWQGGVAPPEAVPSTESGPGDPQPWESNNFLDPEPSICFGVGHFQIVPCPHVDQNAGLTLTNIEPDIMVMNQPYPCNSVMIIIVYIYIYYTQQVLGPTAACLGGLGDIYIYIHTHKVGVNHPIIQPPK